MLTETDLKKDLINKYQRGSNTIQANIYLNPRIKKTNKPTSHTAGNKFINFNAYEYQVRRGSEMGVGNEKLDINKFQANA